MKNKRKQIKKITARLKEKAEKQNVPEKTSKAKVALKSTKQKKLPVFFNRSSIWPYVDEHGHRWY
ncbi:MAG: hypothetical protein HYU69_05700 [Bacteroidetes bacterium]|nr:hypothetical protein [Bacteroidota bacterium]